MNFHEQCPRCDGYDIERVHTERGQSYIAEVYICDECPTQFTVEFGDPIITEVHDAEGNNITNEVVG